MEGDVLRRVSRRGRDRQRREHALGIARRPLQHLHAAKRAAGDREQCADAEVVEQHRLRAHHVPHRDDREVEAPGLAGLWIGRGRPGRTHAGADDVRADHEVTLGVDRPAGADHGFPPARLTGDGMGVGDMLVAGESVADQDRVGAFGIERTVGLIGDLERRKIDAGVEPQRLVGAEAHDRRMRLIRLARAIGSNKRGSDVNHTPQRPFARSLPDLIAPAALDRTALDTGCPAFAGHDSPGILPGLHKASRFLSMFSLISCQPPPRTCTVQHI